MRKRNKMKSISNTFRNLKKTWSFVKEEKRKLIICIVLSGLLSLIGAITPLISARLLLNLTEGLLDKLFRIALFLFIIENVKVV